MRKMLFLMLFIVLFSAESASAHHGIASLGVAGLEGPGAPIETSSSATLPKGRFLVYTKMDYARFRKYKPGNDDEYDANTFFMLGLGYGIKSCFSLYVFLPYHVKELENSFSTSGFADISIMGALGFKYDEGWLLIPENESLDDLTDWHFNIYGGLTLPTGNANKRDHKHELIDPGMQLGFGRPSYTLGFSATKQLSERLTTVSDISYLLFRKYRYHDGVTRQFGDEFRINYALTCRLFAWSDIKMRIDGNFELNYLHLERDKEEGHGQEATGGKILYILPGFRVYFKSASLGLGVKIPVWTNLNEESQQQGAEGKERYRFILSFSMLF